ncbi:unnamed protein product [Cladocopium goreaui]|uniref:Lipoyl-binding domain-containing protein n=1 Tax=Cladocopium goreaui TaxID=2562237 RepID=A0A9P1G0I3_9DINO|nr:unnamed protein product [Cladocopium goreaui]
MASQLIFGEESRELTEVTALSKAEGGTFQAQNSNARAFYWALGALGALGAFVALAVLAVIGASLRAPFTVNNVSKVHPISMFNSVQSELQPTCTDFPRLHILEVTHSNLAGVGPDSGPEGLYYHVRSSKGRDFEMRVHGAKGLACPFPKLNGMHGMYATVNVASKSSANLRFTFHDWHTKQPVVMDDFTITFFDLDHGYGNAGVEEVVIQGDWTQAVVAEDTTILVHQAESSEHKIAFKATEEALRPDEPKNPLHLTLRQFNKAVSLKFVRAKSFTADLKVTTTSQYPRFFEFLGEASILCASNPNGGKLPSGEVYVNRAQLEKTEMEIQHFHGEKSPGEHGLLNIVPILLGLGVAVLLTLIGLYFWFAEPPNLRGYVEMSFQEDKQGPGIFWVTIPTGQLKLGLLLDAPEGINQPPMIKEVLTGGAAKNFNESNPYYAIEAYDAIIGYGNLSDPHEVLEALYSKAPDEVSLQLDRPEKFSIELKGSLGAQLDAFEDSFGAVIMHIEPGGTLAKWNEQNPGRTVNRGDRIIELRGMDFNARKGWKMRTAAQPEGENPFGSRSNSRFLEEMEECRDIEREVTVLKYLSSESRA